MFTDTEAQIWRDFANAVVDIAEGNVSGVRGPMSDLRTVQSYNKRTKMISQVERDTLKKLEEVTDYERFLDDKNAKRILDSVRYETWDSATQSFELTESQLALVYERPSLLVFRALGDDGDAYQGDLSRKYWFVLTKGFDHDSQITQPNSKEYLYCQMSVVYANMFANCIINTVSDMISERDAVLTT